MSWLDRVSEVDLGWYCVSHQGKPLWINEDTKVASQWFKPLELRSNIEKIIASATPWRKERCEGRELHFNVNTRQLVEAPSAEVEDIIAKNRALTSDALSFQAESPDKLSKAYQYYLEKRQVGGLVSFEIIDSALFSDPLHRPFSHMKRKDRKQAYMAYAKEWKSKLAERQQPLIAHVSEEMRAKLHELTLKNPQLTVVEQLNQISFLQLQILEHWKELSVDKIYEIFLSSLASIKKAHLDELKIALHLRWHFERNALARVARPEFFVYYISQYFTSVPNYEELYGVLRLAKQLKVNVQFLSKHINALLQASECVFKNAEDAGLLNAKTQYIDFITTDLREIAKEGSVLPEYADLTDVDSALRQVDEAVEEQCRNLASDIEPGQEVESLCIGDNSVMRTNLYRFLVLQPFLGLRELFETYVAHSWTQYVDYKKKLTSILNLEEDSSVEIEKKIEKHVKRKSTRLLLQQYFTKKRKIHGENFNSQST